MQIPDNLETLENLKNKAMHAHLNNNFEAAIDLYRKIISIDSTYPPAFNNLGCIYAAMNMLKEAKLHLEKAVSLDKTYADACNNLGNIYKKDHQIKSAKQYYQQAISIDPKFADAHNNLGTICLLTTDFEKALAYFKTAIELNPIHIDAYNNIGNTYIKQKNIELAEQWLKKCLDIKPDSAAALYNLGICELEKNNFNLALKLFYQAKDHTEKLSNIEIYSKILLYIINSELRLCKWQNFTANKQELLELFKKYLGTSNQINLEPFMLLTMGVTPDIHAQAAIYRSSYIHKTHNNSKIFNYNHNNKKIKIGYISPDFNQHPITLIIKNMFSYHNKNDFEIYCYYTENIYDKFTDIIKSSCDKFVNLYSLSTQQAAEIINQDQIDILVDLSGHTKNSCLSILSLKPAPIQCHLYGYSSTIGADYIQYFIADPVLVNNNNQKYFTEKIIILPKSYICCNPFDKKIPLQKKKTFNLPEDKFIYCCFCTARRIQPEIFTLWLSILKQTPESILWLYKENNQVEENLKQYATDFDISPERLYFLNNTNTTAHWGHQLANIYLDTTPVSGGTGTLLALWLNLPVITLCNNNPESLTSSSILNAHMLPELICTSPEQYINQAIYYYNNPDKLLLIKERIQANKSISPVFNPAKYIPNLELAYKTMRQQHEQ